MSPGDCIWNVFEITATSNLFEIGIFCFHSHAAHTYKGSSPVVIILVNFVTDCNYNISLLFDLLGEMHHNSGIWGLHWHLHSKK